MRPKNSSYRTSKRKELKRYSVNDIVKAKDLGKSTINKWQSLLTENFLDECIAMLRRLGPKPGVNASKHHV
jgi:hypothetical protein